MGAAVMAGGEADGGLEMTSSAVVTCCKMQYQSHIPSAVFFCSYYYFEGLLPQEALFREN